MSPIFKCLICRKDIERSTKTFWKKKGHLLCSTCLDNIEKNQTSKFVNSKKKTVISRKKTPGGGFGILGIRIKIFDKFIRKTEKLLLK